MTTTGMSSPLDQADLRRLTSLPVKGQDAAQSLLGAAAEIARRSTEALRLYRPMPSQFPFHNSPATERVVRGGNRGGKSTCAAVEFASAATETQLTAADGTPIPFRYPKGPKLMWVVGYDQKHIGQTIYRLLFRPGVFRMIRDKATGEWRSWRPWEPEDKDRENETKPCPPLIPPRFIDPKGWAWENKADRVFTTCRLKDGTEIHAFSSKGEPKQGDPVDLIWVDEDIAFPRHVAEWQARLIDKRGRLIWSAFPHSKNEALVRMSERAKEQEGEPSPSVFEILLRQSHNPFLPAEAVKERLEAWSEDERRARDLGEFLTDTVAMYPNFSKHLHCTPREEGKDKLDKLIEDRGGQIPEDWTRYLVLDPGHAKQGVLFAAVPPPHIYGDHVVIYDEIFARRIDAYALARAVFQKAKGFAFRAFIIDSHAGRQTPMGHNKTIKRQYSEAFESVGLTSELSGSSFIDGSDNVDAGIGLVREWMHIRGDGTTKLRIVTATTPNLQRQLDGYKKHVMNGEPQDRPAAGQVDELCDCARYLAAANPGWYPPQQKVAVESPILRIFNEWTRERPEEDASVHMGAGAA